MKSEGKRNTKERLLQVALKVFAEKGYHSATAQEICQRAGANMAAVNYYFGGKEKLYQRILELVFQTWAADETPGEQAHKAANTPEAKLYTYIQSFFRRSYGIGDGYDPDIAMIVSLEMARPSRFLDQIVRDYIVPDAQSFHQILQALLGPKASDKVLTDCGCSIVGQILYYAYLWPIYIRVNPGFPTIQTGGVADELIDHVYQFSLGGLRVVRDALEDGSHPSLKSKGK